MESRTEYYYRKSFVIYFSKNKELKKIRTELQVLRRNALDDINCERMNTKKGFEVVNFITELIEKTIEKEI